MFIQNKYKKWYDAIIKKAQSRSSTSTYSENHHILPRSLSGSDLIENIVTLTAREHFICHVLLTKFTTGVHRHKMLYAANMMSQVSRDYQERFIPNSRLYEMIKKNFGQMHSKRLTGRTLTEDHKAKISAAGRGRVNSQETIEKRRVSCTGKKRTPAQKEQMQKAQLNRKEKTPEEKKAIAFKLSQALKGKSTGAKTDAHKEKLSKSMAGRNKGILKSEETKQKMRKPKSEAHKKAISEARIAKYKALCESSV